MQCNLAAAADCRDYLSTESVTYKEHLTFNLKILPFSYSQTGMNLADHGAGFGWRF